MILLAFLSVGSSVAEFFIDSGSCEYLVEGLGVFFADNVLVLFVLLLDCLFEFLEGAFL